MDKHRKVAIVTGGNKGIGKGIAIRLNNDGYDVVVVGRDERAGRQAVEELNDKGGHNIFVRTDVADRHQVESMVQKAEDTYGRIDVVVNNAAVVYDSPFLDLTEEIWDKTLDINLKGYFLCAQRAAKVMVRCGTPGRIINITSVQGVTVWPLVPHAPYEVSKAGIIMLTKQLAYELAQYNITVNAVGPGPTDTEILESWTTSPEKLESITSKIPLRRIAKPADVAAVVAFLASEEASYITGITVFVDGGRMTW
jgi:NAD(P)-dependent dehydrogenase (short-subunit alcohol dehydrogenase family)